MDYNRIYKARYLYKLDGVTDIKEIAEQTGLSLEMARKAVNDSMKDYPTIKADFKADQERGDFSRQYEIPPTVTVKGATWEGKKERYFKMLCNGDKTLDGIKSLLIADNVKDTQIEKILNELNERYEEYRAVDLAEIAGKLLQIEQLPPKFTINRAMEVVTVYPSPMLDHATGEIYGVRYTSAPVNWRADLPVDLAVAVYEAEHPLWVGGHSISPIPDRWGAREFEIIMDEASRRKTFYAELREYLGYSPAELQPYITKARLHVKKKNSEPKAETADFKKVARIVAELMREYKANGGNVKNERKSSKTAVADTAVTE